MEDKKELSIRAKGEPSTGSVKDEKGPETAADVAPEVPLAPSPGTDAAELIAPIQQLQAEKQVLYDRLLRRQAELENMRKRIEREKQEFLQHANADLIRALLPSLDGFERALRHRDARVPDEFYKGMELIHSGLLDVLERHGLEPIEAVGQKFDPHLHQAVETIEDEQHRNQEIVEELVRGYKLKHRLLRPSVVKVALTTKRDNPLSGVGIG